MINYVTGDATDPQGDGPKIIIHIVNDAGGWGKGFVVPLARRYPAAERAYRRWHRGEWTNSPFELGRVQFVPVVTDRETLDFNDVIVANMIAQHGYRKRYDDPPERYVDYFHLGCCLERVRDFALSAEFSVHLPRIGIGLGGGSWDVIEGLLNDYLVDAGVSVTVYDPPRMV